jgi:DNA-binding NtrC family response regulator
MDKVLLVCDNPEILGILKEGLQKYEGQFEVLTASGGDEAIELLNRERVSVLVTDLVMPIVDGPELLTHMTYKHPATPCIIMTDHGRPEIKKRAAMEDSFRYFKKPCDCNDLARAIIEGLDCLDEGKFFRQGHR